MKTLPDLLAPGLDIVFVGINPGLYSVERGHYFARRTTRFWPAFSRSVLSETAREALGVETLGPEHDAALLDHGIGFTDVVKRPTANAAGLAPGDFEKWSPKLLEKLRRFRPRIACFHGVTGFRPFRRIALGGEDRAVALGLQPETVGDTRIFLAPNPSGANAHFSLADQAEWYDRLAAVLSPASCRPRT